MSSTMAAPARPSDASSVLPWQEGFAALGEAFFTRLTPTPLQDPYWVAADADAAALLGLSPEWMGSEAALAVFSGNTLLPGSAPLASVYSGHQFGTWAGQLGDGRALLLGETAQGQEIQLKGSGRTPYSRGADGRAVLRSSIREYLASIALHGLGVPTTRALALIGSPTPVQREEIETAAVVTRVAPSFIRFGHFEHFAARGQIEELRRLADYVVQRYYPECRAGEGFGGNAYAALLHAVSERTARLIAQWQAVGFMHGVMNTDNMSILGLTLDYGPFQFMDAFEPQHICNHTDHYGRYAFDQQPAVAHWNLRCLAQALVPLIGDIESAQAALDGYADAFAAQYLGCMRAKLGLRQPHADDEALLADLLRLMAHDAVDYPLFWRRLSLMVATGNHAPVLALFKERDSFQRWILSYQKLLAQDSRALQADLMMQSNPKFVLRNHLAEQAIRAAKLGDFQVLQTLQTLLARPFDEHPQHDAWAGPPPAWASSLVLSCSS